MKAKLCWYVALSIVAVLAWEMLARAGDIPTSDFVPGSAFDPCAVTASGNQNETATASPAKYRPARLGQHGRSNAEHKHPGYGPIRWGAHGSQLAGQFFWLDRAAVHSAHGIISGVEFAWRPTRWSGRFSWRIGGHTAKFVFWTGPKGLASAAW